MKDMKKLFIESFLLNKNQGHMYSLTDCKQGYAEADNPVFVLPAANCGKTVLPSYQN